VLTSSRHSQERGIDQGTVTVAVLVHVLDLRLLIQEHRLGWRGRDMRFALGQRSDVGASSRTLPVQPQDCKKHWPHFGPCKRVVAAGIVTKVFERDEVSDEPERSMQAEEASTMSADSTAPDSRRKARNRGRLL
jgi:hypothetical protein